VSKNIILDFECFVKVGNELLSLRLLGRAFLLSTLLVSQWRRPACQTQYECAKLVIEDCPETAAKMSQSQVVGGLRGTIVLKLSEVYMPVQQI